MSKKIRIKFPIHEKLLYYKFSINVKVGMLTQQNIQKPHYEKTTRITENMFAVNDSILWLKD